MEIPLAQIVSVFLVIATRMSGIMLFAPFFGDAAIPVRIKAALTLLFTVLLYPTYSAQIAAFRPEQWPLLIGREVIIGIALGITATLGFEAAEMAGSVLGVQMGYSLVNILDPHTQVETTVMSAFHRTMAMLIFLALDVHHWILRAVARSFDYLPPGTSAINGSFVAMLIGSAGTILKLGLQIAAPVLGATIAADLVLGALSKASPQLPILLLGPAIKGLLGVILLSAVVRYWPDLFHRIFSECFSFTETVLRLAW